MWNVSYLVAVQILYNGHYHWVATAYGSVYLYDSLAADHLPSKFEEQLAMLYTDAARVQGKQKSTSIPVQQQEGSVDCGVLAVTYAFHAAQGDKVKSLCFQQDEMRKHLQECLEQQELTPFPQTRETIVRNKGKHHYIRLYCKCSLPESYDRQMIKCDSCYIIITILDVLDL